MSSLTPRLALKRPDTPDGFSHQDFVDNYNKLDSTPGRWVCTSTSRPTWGAAQKGMQIKETDTGRTLEWNGASWAEPQVAVSEWGFSVSPNQYVNAKATATYTLGTITLTRPSLICGLATFRIAGRLNALQGVTPQVLIDGNSTGIGGSAAPYLLWNDGGSGNFDHRQSSVLVQASLAAGTHTVQGRITVDDLSTANLYLGNISSMLLLGVGNGGTATQL